MSGQSAKARRYTIRGACHCRNLSFELRTRTRPPDIRARACDCSFCRIHAAKNWSDPNGAAVIRVAEEQHLQRYRFALRTADFYICTVCGAYLAAVLTRHGGTWSTVNLRLTDLDVEQEVASYGSEDIDGRIARRERMWTPTTIQMIIGGLSL